MIKKNLFRLLLILILVSVVIFVFKDSKIMEYLQHPRELKHYILSFEVLAPLSFIALYTLRTLLVVFPVAIFAIISGSLFGFGPGFFYSMVGAFLSATIAFFISRYLARDIVKKYLSDRVHLFKGHVPKGFKIILFLRLIMIMPFDAFSYVVGVTKITYKDFILGTVIGIAPEFLAYSYLGVIGVSTDISLTEKIVFSAVLICIVVVGHIGKKFFDKKEKKKMFKKP